MAHHFWRRGLVALGQRGFNFEAGLFGEDAKLIRKRLKGTDHENRGSGV